MTPGLSSGMSQGLGNYLWSLHVNTELCFSPTVEAPGGLGFTFPISFCAKPNATHDM